MSQNQFSTQTNNDPQPTLQDVLQVIQGLGHKLDHHMQDSQLTHEDILSTMNEFATHIDQKFQGIDRQFQGINYQLDHITRRADHIENAMVTKDYLDDKLFDVRGDLTTLVRKSDRKAVVLTKELLQNRVITEEAAQRILALEPYAQ